MVATAHDLEKPIARILKVNITGETNLNCFYAKSLGCNRYITNPKNTIQPSDLSKLVKIVGEKGVTQVLIGGDEPLLRKDAPNFFKSAGAHKGIQDIRLITNGAHLKTYADPLRKMGLRKVQINHLDSLNFLRYQRITGKDGLYRVLDGIEKVEKLNYTMIQLNILLMRGINDDEIVEFSRMTKDRRIHLRFIEYHPIVGAANDPYCERIDMTVLEAKRMIDNYQRLTQVHDLEEDVHIPTFMFEDGIGKISFLSQMEIEAEKNVPTVVFSPEGVLYNELVPNRPQAILADLRRDAKEDKLHRTIEKVLMLHTTISKATKVTSVAVASNGNGRAKERTNGKGRRKTKASKPAKTARKTGRTRVSASGRKRTGRRQKSTGMGASA